MSNETKREKNRKYRQTHKTQLAGHKKQYYEAHKSEILAARIPISRQYYKDHTLAILGRQKRYRKAYEQQRAEYRLRMKREALIHYGNGKCACVRCGFDDIRALSIDHINGDGATQRRQFKYEIGSYLYSWLKKNSYPEGYQTLCMNCQFIKKADEKEYKSEGNKESQNNGDLQKRPSYGQMALGELTDAYMVDTKNIVRNK